MSLKNPKNENLTGNCYRDFPELYDLLYQRYFRSVPQFVRLVGKNTPQRGAILDLAAGTGEVTIPLLQKGFRVVSLDKARGMLEQLERKARGRGVKNYEVIEADIRNLNFNRVFDTVCIRQAINYCLGLKPLKEDLKKIHRALKPGGRFIFNAPNYMGQTEYPVVENRYQENNTAAFVLETNKLSGRLLRHRQEAIVWGGKYRQPVHIADGNIFYMFTKREFEKSIEAAGFREIKFYSSDLAPCRPSDKTLYGVAQR